MPGHQISCPYFSLYPMRHPVYVHGGILEFSYEIELLIYHPKQTLSLGRKYKQGKLWRTFEFPIRHPTNFPPHFSICQNQVGGREERVWSAAIFIQNQNRSQLKGMSSQIVFVANSRKREFGSAWEGRDEGPRKRSQWVSRRDLWSAYL